ncbi:Ig-like domain-containing protein [Alphaproteobacteria bacterium]|nr:Ig-like domain-containing protein [Alphaproteobacteria bacterium]
MQSSKTLNLVTGANVFDAAFYLMNNADAVIAISQGRIASALDHYNAIGSFELRNPNNIFNTAYYSINNPDALSAVARGEILSVFEHYQLVGSLEGRAPSALFEDSIPVANDDNTFAIVGQEKVINIGFNDRDPNNDELTTVGVTAPLQGTVVYTNNTGFPDLATYTPFSTARGTDSFTYQVSDGNGGVDTATVTLTIEGSADITDIAGDRTTTGRIEVGNFVTGEHTVNDFADFYAFEAIAGKTYLATIEGAATSAGTMIDPLVAAYDSSGLQVLLFDNDSGVGLNASMVAEAYITGTYYIASISGDLNNRSTGSYKLSLAEINTNPIALDDTAFVDAGDTVRINIGLNDTDGNVEDFLSSSGVTQPSKGTVTYSPDSIAGINTTFYDFVDYTANPGASGTDSFVYQVSDGKGGTDTATVTVNINASVTTTSSPGAEVYRFFNTDNEKHFYTKDEFEANSILQNLPQYRLDGPAFKVANPENGPVVDVYRLYNNQSGTHLFTIDTNERDTVLATLDNFVYEGIAYQAHDEPLADTVPLYRFFHTQTGNHFYTVNEAERVDIEQNQSPPYSSEGIKWYVDEPTPIPTLFTPPEDQPLTLLGGILPDTSLIGGGDGGV